MKTTKSLAWVIALGALASGFTSCSEPPTGCEVGLAGSGFGFAVKYTVVGQPQGCGEGFVPQRGDIVGMELYHPQAAGPTDSTTYNVHISTVALQSDTLGNEVDLYTGSIGSGPARRAEALHGGHAGHRLPRQHLQHHDPALQRHGRPRLRARHLHHREPGRQQPVRAQRHRARRGEFPGLVERDAARRQRQVCLEQRLGLRHRRRPGHAVRRRPDHHRQHVRGELPRGRPVAGRLLHRLRRQPQPRPVQPLCGAQQEAPGRLGHQPGRPDDVRTDLRRCRSLQGNLLRGRVLDRRGLRQRVQLVHLHVHRRERAHQRQPDGHHRVVHLLPGRLRLPGLVRLPLAGLLLQPHAVLLRARRQQRSAGAEPQPAHLRVQRRRRQQPGHHVQLDHGCGWR